MNSESCLIVWMKRQLVKVGKSYHRSGKPVCKKYLREDKINQLDAKKRLMDMVLESSLQIVRGVSESNGVSESSTGSCMTQTLGMGIWALMQHEVLSSYWAVGTHESLLQYSNKKLTWPHGEDLAVAIVCPPQTIPLKIEIQIWSAQIRLETFCVKLFENDSTATV